MASSAPTHPRLKGTALASGTAVPVQAHVDARRRLRSSSTTSTGANSRRPWASLRNTKALRGGNEKQAKPTRSVARGWAERSTRERRLLGARQLERTRHKSVDHEANERLAKVGLSKEQIAISSASARSRSVGTDMHAADDCLVASHDHVRRAPPSSRIHSSRRMPLHSGCRRLLPRLAARSRF